MSPATASSSSLRSHAANAAGSSSLASPSNQRRASRKTPSNEHHPFRLEVQQVTPVSISMRWSLRPPPISELRQSGEGGTESLLRKSFAAISRKEARAGSDEDDWPSDDGATAVNDDASDSDDLSDSSEPGQSLDDHSPSTPKSGPSSPSLSRMFDSGVSVVLNGQAWSQVVMGDKAADEAVIVVYGLHPESEYDLEMTVGSQDHRKAKLAARFTTIRGTASGSDSAGLATPEARELPTSANMPSTGAKGTFTPRQASDSGHQVGNGTSSQDGPASNKELSQADVIEALRESLTAELRQARKEASRAEQALRNEIEAIKKSLDRTSAVDHRSKQKVLALQESIRQANQSAKDIAEEAEVVESEHESWEAKEKEAVEKESAAREKAESAEAAAAEKVKEEEDLTAAAEKELAGVQKTLNARISEVEKLEEGKLAELEAQLAELEAEVEKMKGASTPPFAEPMRWSRGVLEPHAPPFQPGQGLASGSGGRGGSANLRGSRQFRDGKGAPVGAPSGSGGKSGPQRHASGGSQANKRGRGGMTGPGPHPHNIMPQALNSSSYEQAGPGYPPMMPYNPADFAGPSGYASAPASSRPAYPAGLNPVTPDFQPGSGHPSPVLARNLSPMLPMPPGSSGWNQGNADFSPQAMAGGGGLNRLPFRNTSGLPMHESPTMGSSHFPGVMRDSPTSGSTYPSSASLLTPSSAYSGAAMSKDRGRRSSSMGSPDESADIFDPTSSGPSMPSPSSTHFSARPAYDLGLGSTAAGAGPGAPPSPWNRTTVLPATEPSPKPGAGPFWSSAAASGAGGATPTMTSSPTLGGPPGGGLAAPHSSSSSSAEDIWGPGPGPASSLGLAPGAGAGVGQGPSSMAMSTDPSGRSSRSTLPSLLSGAGSNSSSNSPVQQSFHQSQAQQWQHPHALGQLYAQHHPQYPSHAARHSPSTSSSSPGHGQGQGVGGNTPQGASASGGAGAGAGVGAGAGSGTSSIDASAKTTGSGSGPGSAGGSLPTSPTAPIGSGSGSGGAGKSGATYGAIGAGGTKS